MNLKVEKIARLNGHAQPVYALEKGRESHLFFSGAGDNVVAEWSLEELKAQNFAVKLTSTVYSICYVPEKKLLLIGQAEGGIHVVDLSSKKEIKHLALHEKGVFDIKILPGKDRFIALSADGSFSVWAFENFSLLHHIKICDLKLRKADIEGEHVALAAGDGTIRIFHNESFTQLHQIEAHQGSVNVVKYHPSKKILISGGKDAHLKFWKTDEGYKNIGAIPAHNFAIYQVDFDSKGQFCATASRDKTVKIWNADTFELLIRLDKKEQDGHRFSVNNLFWSEQNEKLVTSGDDRSIIVWDIRKA